RWMSPERPAPVEVEDPEALFQVALDHAMEQAPNANSFFMRVPYSRSYSPYIFVNWNETDEEGKRSFGRASLLPDGSLVPEGRDTGGGQALYRMHWAFHYIPASIGEIIAGIAAVFMFAAIISGIITHKKIFIDFFTLRFGKGQRSWLDSHNVISVMSLPYQIMITFSGILFVASTFFIPIYLAQYIGTPNLVETVVEDFTSNSSAGVRTGVAAELTDIGPLLAEAQKYLGDEPVSTITVHNPGDEAARINIRGSIEGNVVRDTPGVWFNGVTGEVEKYAPREFTGAETVSDVFLGLHEALFAGPILRVLFFVSGLMGCAMIATGLVLWTKKRRQKLRADAKAERNLIIIERMNVGVIAGLSIAVAAYFWGNRLLPLELAGRAEWEMHTLFLVWLVMIIHSLARPPQKAWTEQLCLAAFMYAFIPVLNALTTDLHLGNTLPLPGRSGNFALAGVDLWLLAIGLGFAYAARISMKKASKVAKRPKRKANSASPVPAE
ncbi:MAG: PepSY-associated TM helix domain-containing protein, partial [Pseudomonadota bacterium]